MRQDLIRRLYNPSIVKRYELPYDNTVITTSVELSITSNNHNLHHVENDVIPQEQQQQNQEEEEQEEEIKARGWSIVNFSLNPTAAMALSSSSSWQQQQQQQSSCGKSSTTKQSTDRSTTKPILPMVPHYEKPTTIQIPSPSSSSRRRCYSWNYLTLRHKQNIAWAKSQFELGVSYAKTALIKKDDDAQEEWVRKAEECYKKGLDMIPHHGRILTAYGALCINDGRYELAKELLERAIRYLQQQQQQTQGQGNGIDLDVESDSDHNNTIEDTLNDAKTYLTVVMSKLHAKQQAHISSSSSSRKQSVQLSNRAEQAMQDVLTERAFVMGNDHGSSKKGLRHDKTSCGDYELLSLSDSTTSVVENDNENDNNDSSRRKDNYHDHHVSSREKHSKHVRKRKRSRREDHVVEKKRHDDERDRYDESPPRRSKRKHGKKWKSHHDKSSISDDDEDRSSIYSESSDESESSYRKRKHSRRRKHKKRKKRRR